MKNEPVAWMLETQRGKISCFVKPSDEFDWIPLYTHPAKTLKQIKGINYWVDAEPKTLTDEEIWGFMDEIEALVHGDIKRAMYRMARKVESILNE